MAQLLKLKEKIINGFDGISEDYLIVINDIKSTQILITCGIPSTTWQNDIDLLYAPIRYPL